MENYCALSTKDPRKKRCGDASFADAVRIGNEEYILLIVADGVSTGPKDWLASATTVTSIVEGLQKPSTSIQQAFLDAIVRANTDLLAGVEGTLGMLSTLIAVLFHPKEEILFLCSIGDSRIYGFRGEKWEQLTVDDSISFPLKVNNKMVLKDGVPRMESFITKAIGHINASDVKIQESSSADFEALILSSDGFYKLPRFKTYAFSLVTATDMQSKALEIQSRMLSEITDDASFAGIRFSRGNAIDLRRMVEHDDGKNVPIAAIIDVLEAQLKQAITERDSEYLDLLLQFMKRRQLFYSKEKMIELLELMIANKSPLIQEMTAIIRQL
jgi:serine/threonine protein phosphatase PrpC